MNWVKVVTYDLAGIKREVIMKEPSVNLLKSIVAVIFSLILIANCAPTDTLREDGPGTPSVDPGGTGNFDEALDLTDHLAKISGIRVVGKGANAQITVRGGQNSFRLSSAPLFVVNDTPQVGGYAAIYGLIDVESITSIKVLKGADAAWYGARGNNGVIVIRTQ